MKGGVSEATWARYFDGDVVSLYVSPQHLRAHYTYLADALQTLLPSNRPFTLLDFGCGEALATPRLAQMATRLLLYDGSPVIRDRVRTRFGGLAGISVLDDDAYAALPDRSVDRVLVISVIQYVKDDDLTRMLAEWRRLLAPDGALILGDVLPPGNSTLADVSSLLRFALDNGFLWAALRGLATTAATDYPKLRRTLGLRCYGEVEMLERLREAGFAARVALRNVSPSPHRRTFIATPG